MRMREGLSGLSSLSGLSGQAAERQGFGIPDSENSEEGLSGLSCLSGLFGLFRQEKTVRRTIYLVIARSGVTKQSHSS